MREASSSFACTYVQIFDASFLWNRLGLLDDLLLGPWRSRFSRFEDIVGQVETVELTVKVKHERWMNFNKTYLRTCVTARSLMPGWKPGHAMHVDLKICASDDMSNERDAPSEVSQIVRWERNSYLVLQ